MIIQASCRADFTNATFQGPLQFRVDGVPVRGRQMREIIAGKRIIVFEHGYKNTFDAASAAYKTIWKNIVEHGLPYDLPIEFYWPGGVLALGFEIDEKNAANSAGELAALFNIAKTAECPTRDAQSHSLGARVLLQAMMYSAPIDNAILSAPAVNSNCFDEGKEFDINELSYSKQLIVAYSTSDTVLGLAYRTLKRHEALGRVGLGLKLPHIVQLNMSDQRLGHSDYKDCVAYYQRWKEAITFKEAVVAVKT